MERWADLISSANCSQLWRSNRDRFVPLVITPVAADPANACPAKPPALLTQPVNVRAEAQTAHAKVRRAKGLSTAHGYYSVFRFLNAGA
jgi:hypothetical protein